MQMKKLLYSFTAITCNTLLIWKYTGEYSLKNLILSLVITAVLGGIALFWILGGKLWKQYAPPMPALPDANGRISTKTGLLIIFGIILSVAVYRVIEPGNDCHYLLLLARYVFSGEYSIVTRLPSPFHFSA